MKKLINTNDITLRQRAEELHKKKRSVSASKLSEFDTLKLIHELEVHQIELEMQNEEVMLSNNQAELATEKYAELYDFAPLGYFTLSEKGNIIDLNLSGSEMLGKERSHLKNRSFSFFVSNDTRPIFNHFLGKVFKSKIKETCEVNFSNNGSLPMNAHLTGIVTKNGEQCLVTVIDITERKRAEKALRESEEKYRVLFEGSTLGILATDSETHRFLYSNQAICRIFGYSDEEFLRLTIPDLHPKDSMDLVISEFESQMRGEKVISSALPCLRKDGTVFYADIAGNSTIINERKCSVGFFVDVTMRKQAEDALKQANSELQNLHNNLDLAVFSADLINNKMLQVSVAHEAMFGYSQEAFFNNTMLWYEIIVPEDKLIVDAGYPVLFSGKNLHHEYRIVHADGQIRWIEAKMKPTLDTNGKLIRIDGIAPNITERKRFEETLRESEVKYQEIFESTGTATFIVEEDATILMANNECCSITGYTATEIIGKKWNRSFAPVSLQEMMKNHKLRRQNPDLAPKKYEVELVNKKGEKRDVILNVSMISGTKQSIISLIDITERKRAEEELNEAKEFTESTLNSITDIFYSFDLSGKFLNWNKTFSRISGYSDQELSSKKPTDFFSGEGIQRIAEVVERIYKEGSAKVDADFVIKDGRQIPCEFTGSVLKDGKGNIIGFSGTARDITERRQAELAIAHSHELMHYIIEHSQSAIAVHDRDLRYIYVSQRYLKEFKVKEKDVIGKHLYEALPDLPQKWRDVHQKALAGEVSSADDDSYEKEDGTIEWIRWECRPWYEANGSVGGFIIYTEVITERKQKELELFKAKEKAEESDRLKSAFLANMSHEVRTPLNSIIGFSELLADPFFEEEQKNEFIQSIVASGNNLLTIISDIMDISKMQSDEITIRKKQINVHKFVSTLKGEFFFETNGNEFELILPDNDEETLVFADVERFRQIFNNLIGNAFKFTSNGKIEIGYLPKDKMVEFFVKDTGIGIPAEYHDTIFERFRQIEIEKTRKYGGNGLGLAISKNLVELMGGRIWLKSEPGKGSVFYFTLPTYNSEI